MTPHNFEVVKTALLKSGMKTENEILKMTDEELMAAWHLDNKNINEADADNEAGNVKKDPS